MVLSGGSAFGLDAGGRRAGPSARAGRGFAIGNVRVPLVCGAVAVRPAQRRRQELGPLPPYRDLGYAAAAGAGETFALGTAGAGFGATTINLKGGLGSASAHDPRRPHGRRAGRRKCLRQRESSATGRISGRPHSRSERRIRRVGFPARLPPTALIPDCEGAPGENTTIAVVATDAALTKAQARNSRSWRRTGWRARSTRPTRRSMATPCSPLQPAAARSPTGQRARGARRGRGQCAGPRGRAGGIRGQGAAWRPPSWQDCHS